ncbi:hypothetical protein [Sphingomonas sanxanigenens]|uniref:Uncharacterized protein n=1 Tax=Sphingomonas sanxanigenens DSM 19645 = NX02 TaxID=1123269 RepID=W0ACA4_9SPHN|nr:hypothetical protein [Sphingomonas sanxanigenens]AHE54716.1 hypothetical protein NX02_15165 [Sphingomonas sanxanigenens DSM 19645 = NX02]
MTALMLLAAAVGVLLVRAGWPAGARRRGPLLIAGWGAIAISLIGMGRQDGAWGVTMVALVAMVVAQGALAVAALEKGRKAKAERAPREAEPTVALSPGGWAGLGRRVTIFLLVVPFGAVVAMLFALALLGAVRAAGWHDANSTPLGLLLWPIAWALLATWMLMYETLARIARPLAFVAAPSALALWLSL